MPSNKRTQFFRDSVFRFTMEPQISEVTDDIGEFGTLTCKTSVSLTEDEMDWLDANCWAIRHNGWRGITRSTFIRALIHAVGSRPIDLQGVTNDEQLVDALRRAFAAEQDYQFLEPLEFSPKSQGELAGADRKSPEEEQQPQSRLEDVATRIRALPVTSKRLGKLFKATAAFTKTGYDALRTDQLETMNGPMLPEKNDTAS